jgi:hypothetical protein
MSFQPKTREVNANQLTMASGASGLFYVKKAGLHRDAGNCIYYGDEHFEFFFYAKWIRKADSAYEVVIRHASLGRMDRWIDDPPAAHRQRLITNLTQLFKERQYYDFKILYDPSEAPPSVQFERGVR